MPSNNSSSLNKKKEKQRSGPNRKYRSNHVDYRPFLKYIEHHIDIDDEIVEQNRQKLASIKSNLEGAAQPPNLEEYTKSAVRNQYNMISKPGVRDGGFFDQKNSASLTKRERDAAKASRDAERHADLHANYKAGDFTDGDKIFLLKREIDTLRETIANQRQRSNFMGSSNRETESLAPLLTALLFLGLVVLSARAMGRKLSQIRASDSLLAADFDGASEGFELREGSNFIHD